MGKSIPIVLQTGHIQPELKMAREQVEKEYTVPRLRLVPPDVLSERAKLKFQQIVAEAFWLDELSVDLLASYCHAWDRWLDCVAAMDTQGEVTLVYNRKNGETTVKQNPYRQALKTYVSIMEELSAKLGLGNIDRLRLAIPEAEKRAKEDPFDEFMADVE